MDMVRVPLQILAAGLRREDHRPRAGIANDEDFRMTVQPGIDIAGWLQRPQRGRERDLFCDQWPDRRRAPMSGAD